MEEFIHLQQHTLTVSQYVAKFLELSRFAPDFVSTEERKTRRFIKGLRVAIRSRVIAFMGQQFTEVVDRAMLIEQELEIL